MSSFETQIISENPRVILLGNYQPFIDKMAGLLSEFQLDTWTLTANELMHLDFRNLDNQTVYKLIWWLDLDKPEEIDQIRQILAQNTTIPKILLGVLPESYSLLEPNQDILSKQKLLQQLISEFTDSQYFLIRDLVAADYFSPIFKFSLQNLSKGKLLLTQGNSNLINLDVVTDNLRTYLFKPATTSKIILQGKTVSNQKILEYFAQIYSRVYGHDLELVSVDANYQKFNLPDELVVKLNTDEKKILDQIIENQIELKKQLANLPHLENQQLAELNKIPVVRHLDSEKTDLNLKTNKDIIPIKHQNENEELKELIDQSNSLKNSSSEPFLAKEEKIEGELSRLFKEKRELKKEKRIDEKVKIVKKISSKSKKNRVLFVGGVGVMILGGVTLALWLILSLSVFLAKKEFISYLYNNTPQSNQVYQPGFWPSILDKQTSFYQKILGEIIADQVMVASLFSDFQALQNLQLQLEKEIQNYTLGVLGSAETRPIFPPEINQLATEIDSKISNVENAIFYLSPEETPEQTKWIKYLEEVKEQLAKTKQYPEFFTEFFGGNGKKTYAVLLQNNLEIRATGGFIQGFILLTFDKGLLIDSQIFNTNEVDTRLPGNVASPEEVQRYLGEKNWFIRDSNWEPDFPTTANRVGWFIKEALKKQVDGVIALNYYVTQDILGSLGSLEVPDYQETLTKDNLLERVEFHSDEEFINQPNSGQKDYSATVYKQLLSDLKQISPAQANKLAEALGNSLANKNLLISLFDEKTAEFLQATGWSGEVISPICPQRFPQTNCLVNQIYQVESNIGLNRVNEYIKRTIEERVEFQDKKIKHLRTVTYTNTAKSDGWPLGSYKLYLRFITGKETQPREVLINGKKLDGALANVYLENDKKIVGFPLEIHKDSTVTVQYIYETDKLLDEPFSYLLFDQKQPGIKREDLKTTFYFPNRKPTLIAPQGTLSGDTLEFNSLMDDHSFVGVSLQNK
ncbi:MAG: DUF4012 domain-containing protein [Candidatus Pacebacteria bacterium]|nr:DUF4012 domain-containing protein [Candidatus Paceibacterota bacterium]